MSIPSQWSPVLWVIDLKLLIGEGECYFSLK